MRRVLPVLVISACGLLGAAATAVVVALAFGPLIGAGILLFIGAWIGVFLGFVIARNWFGRG